MKSLDFERLPVERALGVHWDVYSDTLSFEMSVRGRPPTRRGILSVISSTYDPLRFASPCILQGRSLLRDLCQKGLEWDDVISQEDLQSCQSWLKDLPKLESLEFDRCFKPRGFVEIVSTQLHTFPDASHMDAVVSYLRFVNSKGRIHCAFFLGKARLTPMKQVTIPRLELTAAATSTRVSNMIHREVYLPITEVLYWTDSTCVLGYISNPERRFKTFAANKNVADDVSRGLSAGALSTTSHGKRYPTFCRKQKITSLSSPCRS